MKYLLRAASAIVGAVAIIATTWQTAGSLHSTNDAVQQRCDQGQSQAVIEIPATTAPGPTPTPVATGTPTAGPTSTPGPFSGLIYFATATNNQAGGNVPNPYGSPLAVTPANSSTYTSSINAIPTSGPELKYYVTLGADQWIEAVLSSPDPNRGTAAVRITCTTAVARNIGGGGGGTGPPGPAGSPGPPGSPGPAGSPAPTPPTMEQNIENFCTANSISGCHYWPMNETTGTVMYDAIGSLNGTYATALTDGGSFLPGWSIGLTSGEKGVDMWGGGSASGHAYITPMPTPVPAEGVFGIVVRDCDEGTTAGANAVSYFGPNEHVSNNTGLDMARYEGALIGQVGSGTSFTSGNLIGEWPATCAPFLLMGVGYYNVGANEGPYFEVNGLPNYAENASQLLVFNPYMYINAFIDSGGNVDSSGSGDVYCCAFYIPGNFTAQQLEPIQAGFDLLI
jgi:hypothetical protein